MGHVGPEWMLQSIPKPRIWSDPELDAKKSLQEISKNVFIFVAIHNWNWSSYNPIISICLFCIATKILQPRFLWPQKSLNISCWRIQVHTFNPQISSTFSEGKEVPLPTLGNQPLLSRRHSWRDICLEKSQVERVNEPVTNLRNHFPQKGATNRRSNK